MQSKPYAMCLEGVSLRKNPLKTPELPPKATSAPPVKLARRGNRLSARQQLLQKALGWQAQLAR